MKPDDAAPGLHSELLIMPDGTIFVHNLTPEMAAVLRRLNPTDTTIGRRAPAPSQEPPHTPGASTPGASTPGASTPHPPRTRTAL